MKTALVTDWIYGGGGERVVEEIHKMYPDAPIYTSYCSDDWRNRLDNKVVTGYLQKTPFRQLRKFLPLLRQWWFAHLDLTEFDLVISISGNGEAKFVRAPNGKHVMYCHTPVHFYWRKYAEYIKDPGFKPKWLVRFGLKALVKPLRKRDYAAAQTVDYFIANSTHIQSDIKKFYGRESEVVHPPVSIERFGPTQNKKSQPRSGFVTLGRLVPNKRVDLIIRACNELRRPLHVVGRGPELKSLQKIAGPTITFISNASDDEVAALLARAEGFIFASLEDFGIAPVEALASGTPVIAYKAGGALDYVIEGKTGAFFVDQTVRSLIDVLKSFNPKKYNSNDIKKSAQKFSSHNFQKNLHEALTRILQ